MSTRNNPSDKAKDAFTDMQGAAKGVANNAGERVSKTGDKMQERTEPTMAEKAQNDISDAGKTVGDAIEGMSGGAKK
jgi:hypothetical protein